MKTNIYLLFYLDEFFLECKIFQTKVIEKIEIHMLCLVTFCRKSCRLWDGVEKYGRAVQATYENMAHAHLVLDT